ncbi:MAG: hypothetical protein ACRCUT_03175, partial [Spirochaetota bacterium]
EQSVYIRTADQQQAATASLEINPSFISQTALGRIPLINDYKITKSYSGTEQDSASKIIILENSSYYESISVKNGIPDKVKILSKNGVDAFEVHYSDPTVSEECIFFRKVSAFSENTDNRFEIEYTDIKMNSPIDRDRIFRIDIPRGTKILH